MKWYRDIKAILASEPETWLAYLYGQKLEDVPAFLKHPPRLKGVVAEVLIFFAYLAKYMSWRREPKVSKANVKYLVFASTLNQLNSLDDTVVALRNRGNGVLAITARRLISSPERKVFYRAFGFSPLDVLKATMLFFARAPGVYRSLKREHPAKRRWYFHHFCYAYPNLVYFYGLLKGANPDYVILSNDHNCANRCCLAVAHYLGIRTVYMQHASVSPVFPALRVNFAFLDGSSALETYRECESNQPVSLSKAPSPLVILSGQKKKLTVHRGGGEMACSIGLALNLLDDVEAGLQLAEQLVGEGYTVVIRWHPGQRPEGVRRIRAKFGSDGRVILSDPKQERPGGFLNRLRIVIAGNTSLLLEAAIVGVLPIYYELQLPQFPDYYGFVRKGLALHAKNSDDLLRILAGQKAADGPEPEAVRHFSATYGTEWDGREGELVARCLEALDAGQELGTLAPTATL